MRRQKSSLLAAVVASFAASGCGSDNPTSPPSRTAPDVGPAYALLSAPVSVTGLRRIKPLPAPIAVTATLGPLGGRLSVPGAGLTVVVPPLALSKTTTITVTALAGNLVAYEFAPSGTKFLVPLVATQDLRNTNTSGLNVSLFSAGYFKSTSDINFVTVTASVGELLSVNVSLLNLTATFTIPHFSGYLVATGRADE